MKVCSSILNSPFVISVPDERRKSSCEASRLASIADDLPEDSNNGVTEAGHFGHQASSNAECSTSKQIIISRMPGSAKNPDKDLSSSSPISRIDGPNSRQSMSDHAQKSMRELPSPAALNNLSQRAQDILKKLYSAGEKTGLY